jgi:hypothetical protein
MPNEDFALLPKDRKGPMKYVGYLLLLAFAACVVAGVALTFIQGTKHGSFDKGFVGLGIGLLCVLATTLVLMKWVGDETLEEKTHLIVALLQCFGVFVCAVSLIVITQDNEIKTGEKMVALGGTVVAGPVGGVVLTAGVAGKTLEYTFPASLTSTQGWAFPELIAADAAFDIKTKSVPVGIVCKIGASATGDVPSAAKFAVIVQCNEGVAPIPVPSVSASVAIKKLIVKQ